jgi:twitching motility protein PilT
MDVMEILRDSVERRASDIILSAGAPVTFHVHGALEPLDPDWILSPSETHDLVYQFLTMEQRKVFEIERELDIGYHVPDLARFRVSVYQQRGTLAAVLRLVPLEIPDTKTIGLSDRVLMQMVNQPHGLILVTGPTGSGKSTTIASYLEYLNTVHGVPRHIITLEDPVEFALQSKDCVIDQRELGHDTFSYVQGLRSALRQMPHVIFVGEMRDRETMEVALTAAETGNVVISTLSTQSAGKTINRIIDVFPVEHQAEIRTRLALTLRVAISQTLLRRKDGLGRVCAREIMFVNAPISNLIREGKIHQLNNAIGTHYAEGMKLLDDSLVELYKEGLVEYVDVVTRIQDPEKLKNLRGE